MLLDVLFFQKEMDRNRLSGFFKSILTYFNHVLRSEIMEFESFYTHISSWAKINTTIFLSRLYKI